MAHRTCRPLEDRFWEKVQKGPEEDCWEWQAGLMHNGYGQFSRRDGGTCIAHRVSWELHFGPIPEGMVVCHRCDNKTCVNPSHLFVGTQRDNVHDMRRKGRENFVAGERHPGARLSDAQVRALREMARTGESYTAVAREFGISVSHARDVVLRKRWASVDDYPEVVAQRDQLQRLFNRLEAAITHHKTACEENDVPDTHDEALWAARDRVLRDAAQRTG